MLLSFSFSMFWYFENVEVQKILERTSRRLLCIVVRVLLSLSNTDFKNFVLLHEKERGALLRNENKRLFNPVVF